MDDAADVGLPIVGRSSAFRSLLSMNFSCSLRFVELLCTHHQKKPHRTTAKSTSALRGSVNAMLEGQVHVQCRMTSSYMVAGVSPIYRVRCDETLQARRAGFFMLSLTDLSAPLEPKAPVRRITQVNASHNPLGDNVCGTGNVPLTPFDSI